MFAAGARLADVIDGIAAHPYACGSPLRPGDVPRRVQFGRLDDLLATLHANGAGDRPVWITEVGWTTCARRPQCTNERRQGQYLRQLFQLVASRYRDVVQAVVVYHLYDFAPGDRRDEQQHFGLVRRDGSRKPAFDVLRAAARQAR